MYFRDYDEKKLPCPSDCIAPNQSEFQYLFEYYTTGKNSVKNIDADCYYRNQCYCSYAKIEGDKIHLIYNDGSIITRVHDAWQKGGDLYHGFILITKPYPEFGKVIRKKR
jgi:hypothetical protein